jgi:hypothetical protein
MATKTLVTNQVVSAPLVSPAANLSGGATYWTATLDTTAHAGVHCEFTIQDAPASSGPWTDVSNNSFDGSDGTSHLGWDLSHQVQSFTLFGSGPWWRINITAVTGTFTANSLIVTNQN